MEMSGIIISITLQCFYRCFFHRSAGFLFSTRSLLLCHNQANEIHFHDCMNAFNFRVNENFKANVKMEIKTSTNAEISFTL